MNQLVELLNNNPEKKERDVILEFENLTKEIQSYDHSKNILSEACMVGDIEKLLAAVFELIEKMEQSYTKRELSLITFIFIKKFFDK